ncbi:SIP domain-containing protein [Mycetocola spongiae]|nr:SIP domain-containing protein [Mycetocola spongiae]
MNPGSHAHSTLRSARAAHSASDHAHRLAHLISGGLSDLPEIEALLATLPICATGRVFIEVDTPEQVSQLGAPSRMVVSWLVRSERSGAPGSGLPCAPGQALGRAVIGWAGEMLCSPEVEPAEAHEPRAQVWLAGHFSAVADSYDYLTDTLGMDPAHIHTPRKYGIGSRH